VKALKSGSRGLWLDAERAHGALNATEAIRNCQHDSVLGILVLLSAFTVFMVVPGFLG
jgi:hypothetical protein